MTTLLRGIVFISFGVLVFSNVSNVRIDLAITLFYLFCLFFTGFLTLPKGRGVKQ